MSLSVIIPSKNTSNLIACLRAIASFDPGHEAIVVNDGVDESDLAWEPRLPRLHLVRGVKPFVFARNVNLGIAAAGSDDVVILNDDAILETPGGFSRLQRAAQENPEYGLIAATCNNVGNRNQWPRTKCDKCEGNCVLPHCPYCGKKYREYFTNLRDEERMVCFVCVLIPRRTINTVGLLDERFVGYGMDDDDYSRRVLDAGLKIGIHDGCYVDHGSLTSSYRGDPKAPSDFRPNLRVFIQKYGVDNWGKTKEESQFPECFA